MNQTHLIRSYEFLADRADKAFHRMKEEYSASMLCEPRCSDCCHAVFGLFLIEASNIHQIFSRLSIETKNEVLTRCEQADRDLRNLEDMMRTFRDDPRMRSYALAKERVRCPLLDDNDMCVLYDHRPITCRVYGIPTSIGGKARVCGKTGFRKGENYPVFDLDGAYRDLHDLSRELLTEAGSEDLEKASLLISVSKALKTPLKELIDETFQGPAEAG